jgi:polysaccharide export outer membrane protein
VLWRPFPSGLGVLAAAQAAAAPCTAPAPAPSQAQPGARPACRQVTPPPDYVIGADDQLAVIFWRETAMSAEVTVRPDGKISLPLLNDIVASGLTPDQLRVSLTEASKFIEPTVTVVVKVINSRRVFITGQIGKPGRIPHRPTTVLQLLALAAARQHAVRPDSGDAKDGRPPTTASTTRT